MEQRIKYKNEMTTKTKEKFTIQVTDHGLEIHGDEGQSLQFTAVEALMLLDILRIEEETLREMADTDSPLPLNIRS